MTWLYLHLEIKSTCTWISCMNVSGYLQGSESSVALNFNSVFASDFKKVKYTQKVWHELSSKYIFESQIM
jgi:hypothetical protein